MPREGSLSGDSQYARVYQRGRAWGDDLLVLKALPNGTGSNRYGFVVSKRVGNAVARNRVKRRLREIARLTPTHEGWDLVLIARKGAGEADYRRLEGAVKGLLRRARLSAEGNHAGGEAGKRQ